MVGVQLQQLRHTIYYFSYLFPYLDIIHYMHHVEWLGLWPTVISAAVVCPPSH